MMLNSRWVVVWLKFEETERDAGKGLQEKAEAASKSDLGSYGANTPDGIRTRVAGMKTRCPGPD